MGWELEIVLGFIGITSLLMTGLPIFVVFLLVNVVGTLIFFGNAGFGLFSNSLLATLLSESFVTIPLYFLMGELLFRSGAMETLYDGFDRLIRRTRLRMYVIGLNLSTVLGTLSGSAMADAALLARTLYPGMVARGYDPRISAGLVMAGATLAPIIPPSILAVIIATLANVSIAKLLIAGFIPGIFLALLFYLYIRFRVWIDPSKAPQITESDFTAPSAREKAMAVVQMLPFGLVLAIVMGSILVGVATPSESAALGVAITLALAAIRRVLKLRMVLDAMYAAARTSTLIFLIIMSANLFGQLLAYTGAPDQMVQVAASLAQDRWLIYFILMAVAFFSCMFLGQTDFMLISIPIYAPIIHAVGLDPIWFWMLYLINITTAAMTPPFGVTIYVFQASVPGMKMSDAFAATWPFVAVIIAGMAIMSIFPEIVTIVPSLM